MKNNSIRSICIVFGLLLPFVFTALASAAPPKTISYQGYLKDGKGAPVTSERLSMKFALYATDTGGEALWSESQGVAVQNGVYGILLGSVTPLKLLFDIPYYLGVTVGEGSEMTPRHPLTSVPYAIRSDTVGDGAVTSAGIGGIISPDKLDLSGVVKKGGDSMTGPLTLPANGLTAGGSQLALSGGNVGIGTATPAQKLDVAGTAQVTTLKFSGDGTSMTSAGLIPPMNGPYFLNAVFAGDLKSARTASSVILSKELTVTRAQVTLRDPGASNCWPRPTILISDGATGVRIPLTNNAHYDTGPLVLPFATGSTLSVQLLPARMSATCATGYPADANVTMEYRLKAPGDALSCGAGNVSCNGICTFAPSDADNCTACGSSCPDGKGCVAGFCGGYCPAGQTRCYPDGPCLDMSINETNCGACNVSCGVGQICVNGMCDAITCDPGKVACPGATGAACVDITTDAANCGACGFDCRYAVTGAKGVACVNGSCQATSCATGWGDCDGNLANGCETPLQTSQNCSTCGAVCSFGICQLFEYPSWVNGQTVTVTAFRCSGTDAFRGDGCSGKVYSNTPVYECWEEKIGQDSRYVCGWRTLYGGSQVDKCDDGNPCTVDACLLDKSGCTHTPQPDGTDCLLSTYSGSYSLTWTKSVCKSGACQPLCPKGQLHCGSAPDFLCGDVLSDGENCGACGRICKSMAACQNAECVCSAPYSDCGSSCRNLLTDATSCGTCGNVCQGGYPCTSGECKCPTGQTLCDGVCVDLTANRAHCGACGAACASGSICTGSACVACGGSIVSTQCGNKCANLLSDRNNCGSCGHACRLTSFCSAGQCN